LEVEVGDEAVGVDDVKRHFLINGRGLLAGWIGGTIFFTAGTTERPAGIFLRALWAAPPCAGEQAGFEQRDAIEAPGGVDEFLDELSFSGSGGLVFVEELAAMGFVGGWIFGGQDDGLGGEAVADGVE